VTDIKFCGLTRPADAAEAARLGAAYLGVILAGGPRLVTPAHARVVLDGAVGTPARRVGVFGHVSADEVLAVAEAAQLDVVQLHGDPTAEQVEALRGRFEGEVWPVLRLGGIDLPAVAVDLWSAAGTLVLDSHVAGALGGTGTALPWDRLRDAIAARRGTGRLVLAGGLRPANVAAAIGALMPDVVDVSSGVELAPGIKDAAAMAAFAYAVASPTQ
jgi:phosphoribosylanthranilate isomerase